MNRKQRRAAESQARKNREEAPTRSPAEQMQDQLLQVVGSHLTNDSTPEDVLQAMDCLLMTAIGFGLQLGISEQEFVARTSMYLRQLYEAVQERQAEQDEGPSLVIP